MALPRWSLVLAASLLVLAAALALPRGGPGALVMVVLCVVIATAIAELFAEPADRRWVLLFVVLAVVGREALTGAIDAALLSRGNRWYAPDEHIYIEHAATIWQVWTQPGFQYDPTDPYLTSWYVHAMARLYLVFGENITVAKAFNTLIAIIACLFGYRIMRNLGMPGARWALVLMLGFPSVAFWTALALKDAWVIFWLLASALAASEFVARRNWLWLAASFLLLVPLETVRLYMLVTGALALLAVPFALPRWGDRLRASAGVLVGLYVLFAYVQPFRDFGPNIFYIPIFIRESAAQGARSSYVEPLPVIQGQPGEKFQIAVTSGSTPEPGMTPRVVVVEPGTAIVIASAAPSGSSPAPTSAGGVTPSLPPGATHTAAVVRPGDIVVIASPQPSGGRSPSPVSPTPIPSPRVITLEPDAKNTVGLASDIDPDQSSVSGSLTTNFRHLPIGMTFTLFAPFPWTARTGEQFATIPEMVLWYLCLVAAVVGFVWLLRRRDTRYAQGVAAIIGLTIVLSLIGANVGTLIRSRAMLVPYVLMLTGVGIDALLARYPRIGARFPWLIWPRSPAP